MRPEIIVENTLRPSEFAAAAAAGVVGTATSKGDNTFFYIVLAFLAFGIGFSLYHQAKEQAEERVRQMQRQ